MPGGVALKVNHGECRLYECPSSIRSTCAFVEKAVKHCRSYHNMWKESRSLSPRKSSITLFQRQCQICSLSHPQTLLSITPCYKATPYIVKSCASCQLSFPLVFLSPLFFTFLLFLLRALLLKLCSRSSSFLCYE